jgi:dTDP-4-amino-4,6-dideoxygalactose transaminase
MTRTALSHALAAEGVDTRTYYDPPVHRQTGYAHLDSGRPLPATELLAARSLSLPLWSTMSDDTALGICQVIRRAWESAQGG